MSHFSKIIAIIFILVVAASLTLIVRAQDTMKSPQYKLEDSYFEIQRTPYSQNLPLVKKENDREEIVGQVRLVDRYLISDVPENEFLEKFSQLKPGFQDLKISIEADQPLFKKENFYHPLSLLEKTKSLFGFETLPEYRLTKEIKDISENLETNLKIPGLEFKTSYRETDRKNINEEKRIKQNLAFKNDSEKEINLQLTLTHSFEGEKVFFGGVEYLISEKPQFLPFQISNSVSFSSDGKRFTYNFSDLLDFNPEVWIFKRGSKNLLLIKIYLSLLPHSSITIDPSYTVDTTSDPDATAYSFQRKTWWDGTRYWAAFNESAGLPNYIEFWYSTDGTEWAENAAARLPLNINDFSIIGDSSDVFIIYSDGTDVAARQDDPLGGSYPGTGWSWGGGTTLCAGGLWDCQYPHMNRDSSDYIWAVYRRNSGLDYEFIARRSSTTNDISQWNAATNLDDSFNSNKYGVIVPQDSSNNMYAIWIDGIAIEGKKYDPIGAGWDEEPTPIDTGVTGLNNNMSVVHDTTNYYIHLSYIQGGRSAGEVAYTEYITSWSEPFLLDANASNQYTTISINTSNDDLYAFWERDSGGEPTTYTIYYKKGVSPYTPPDWDESATEWQTTTAAIKWVTSNYSDNNKIYGIWTQGTGDPVNVKWAEVTISVNATPTVGTVILNNGNDITLTENATTTVSATATVTDTDGYGDITSVDGKIFRSGVGTGCTADDNNCYVDSSCATSSCSGNSCNATCTVDIWFHADPTDSGTYSAQYWEAWIQATDDDSAKGSATSSGVEVNTLNALAIDVTTIDYGSLNSGSTTGSTNQGVTSTATGNVGTEVYVYGEDMAKGSATISVSYQEFSTSTFTYGSGTDLSNSSTSVGVDMSKPTSHPSTSTDNIYWGAEVPAATPKGNYYGTTTFGSKPL